MKEISKLLYSTISKALLLSLTCCPVLLLANDQDLNAPAPESVEGIKNSLSTQFDDSQTANLNSHRFLEDSSLTLNLRNYYLDKTDTSTSNESSAWAEGGSLAYQSGKFDNFFSLAAEYFGSVNLDSSDDEKSRQTLSGPQKEYAVLGVFNPKLYHQGSTVSLYRQRFNYAYLNDQFSRMTPNTFEGYVLSSSPLSAEQDFQYIIGYVDKIKLRNADNFISMSEAAGAEDSNKGTYTGGIIYDFNPNLEAGFANYYTSDTLNIFYTESKYKTNLTKEFALDTSVQFSDQRSVGEDLITGDSFSSHMWGIRNSLSYRSVILRLAFNSNSDGASLSSPYGSYPSYTGSILDDFKNAGEESWKATLSYNFARLGYKGISFSTSYTQGNDAIKDDKSGNLPDRNEVDLTVDFKPEDGVFKDFWLRIRTAQLNEADTSNNNEFRVILNYNFSVLEPEGKWFP